MYERARVNLISEIAPALKVSAEAAEDYLDDALAKGVLSAGGSSKTPAGDADSSASAPTKKEPAKKPPAKKVAAEKPAKKAPAKKSAAKKTAAEKPAKKAAAKKATAKKTAAKK